MTPSSFLLKSLARMIKVPEVATEMFTAANRMSGLDTHTLPTELIPLNATQLARGLLNFTALQALRGWVLPYWARRQYDPGSASFIPRSHLGLSINVTHRNWTGIGNPSCNIEPIVDPRGLVTPFRDGWSIDAWLAVEGKILFPSLSDAVDQHLIHHLPLVQTQFEAEGVECTLTSYTRGHTLCHQVQLHNKTGQPKDCRLAFAVRPFNPEGVSLLHQMKYIGEKRALNINNNSALIFEHLPDIVLMSRYEDGDVASRFPTVGNHGMETSVSCQKGLATGIAEYSLTLDGDCKRQYGCQVALTGGDHRREPIPSMEDAVSDWNVLLTRGASLVTPDEDLNATFSASLSSLLMLTDGSCITPGPFTYHQFWFRDAAYMLGALDKLGFEGVTGPIIRTFPERQERSGFFRSQKGEWDSNGQVLWTVWQHALRTGERSILPDLFPSLLKGVQWIGRMRLTGNEYRRAPFHGLFPSGLSAEHLGLADHYFWDNAWSIGGLDAFIKICSQLGRNREGAYARRLVNEFLADLESAVQKVQQQYHITEIPASPTRRVDCGMIGSCCFFYPLQILRSNDPRMAATVNALVDRFCVEELFFQDFIHSGMNPYLTLQIAQAILYQGGRERFWRILKAVLSKATPTYTFPEAIHPKTGGGTMGDGHHGWACAEIVHAIRDAFVREQRNFETGTHDLVLCSGIPGAWFRAGNRFGIYRTRTLQGLLSLSIECGKGTASIAIDFKGNEASGGWILTLPLRADEVHTSAETGAHWKIVGNETHVPLSPGHATIRIRYPV